MRPRTVSVWIAAPVSLALLTTACGGGGSDGDATGAAQADATISVNSTEPENPLVPGNTNETGGGKVVDALFTGLVEYDPRSAEPRNAVAESIETSDSRVYTIRLNEGWTFHDGTPVTAQSFVNSWNYTAYSPNGQQNSSFFAQIQGFAEVHPEDPDGESGLQEASQPAAQEMSGLRAVDDLTLEVTLAEPYSNPAVDELLARADAAPSTEEGNRLYQEAERMIIQDMPAIPLYFQSVQAGWSERLENVTVTQLRELDLFSVTVSQGQ